MCAEAAWTKLKDEKENMTRAAEEKMVIERAQLHKEVAEIRANTAKLS